MLHLNGFPVKIVDLNRISSVIPKAAVVMDNAVVNAPKNGQCTADGNFIWVAATATVPGHWERLRVGQTCDPANIMPGGSGPEVREHRADMPGSTPGGGVSVSPTRVMKVGPFTIPVVRSGASYIWGLDDYYKLKPDQAATIKAQVIKKISGRSDSNWINYTAPNHTSGMTKWDFYAALDARPGSTTTRVAQDGGAMLWQSKWPNAAPWGGACDIKTTVGPGCWLTNMGWMQAIGFNRGDAGYDERYFGFDGDRYMPFARFKHPDSGDDYGIWVRIQPVGGEIPAVSSAFGPTYKPTPGWKDTTISNQLQFKVGPIPDSSWWDDAWDWISDHVGEVIAEFYEAVWDAAEAISDALCAVTATPGALTAAASAAGPYGTAAGAATELLMDGKCPIPNPTPAGTPGPPTANKVPFPWALVIGGVAVVAGVVLLGQKKSTS